MPKTLMQSVVSQLQKERTRIEDELHRVTAALSAFGKVYLRAGKSRRKKRTISAAGRKRIAAAQRARWAKVKAGPAAKPNRLRSRSACLPDIGPHREIVAAGRLPITNPWSLVSITSELPTIHLKQQQDQLKGKGSFGLALNKVL
jgi:hypothetical protein